MLKTQDLSFPSEALPSVQHQCIIPAARLSLHCLATALRYHQCVPVSRSLVPCSSRASIGMIAVAWPQQGCCSVGHMTNITEHLFGDILVETLFRSESLGM